MENDVASPMYNPNHRCRRTRRNIKTTKILTGQVAFRIVCHVSVFGGLIGKAGSIISTISAETGCVIRCQEVIPGSDLRVVLVVGSGSIDRKIVLFDTDAKEGEKCGEVSSAQEAVVRVFERVWEVEAEIQGKGDCGGGDDVSYCGLLADKTHIGAVIGKGGRNVTRIRRETGAKIRMLPPPTCAAKDDELIQITGGTLAVKKALIAVTSCLQDCSPVGNDLGLSSGPVEMVRHGDSPDPHRELFADLYSFLPPSTENSVNSVSQIYSSSTYVDRESSLDTKGTKQEVAFRLLCSNNAAGGIIGKRGAIVRDLENQSGAFIKFAAPLTGSSERVVTVSALENPDTWDSPAQNAVNLVFSRSVEVDNPQGFSSGMSKDSTITAKLLVGSDMVGCLTANGVRVVLEIINKTGADIQILGGEQVLDYASENDLVVQITGKYKDVQNALFQVTGRLRQNHLSVEVLNEANMRSCNGRGRVGETTSPGLHQALLPSPHSKPEAISRREVHQYELSNNKDDPASTKSYQPQNKGRGHTTATTNGEQDSRTLGRSSKIVKSLDYLLPTEVQSRSPSGGVGETISTGLHKSLGQFPDSGEQNNLPKRVAQLGLFDNIGGPSKLQASKTKRRGRTTAITNGEVVSTTFARGSEFQSGKKPVFVANTTVEIVVAENVFGCVYGKDGSNLAHLKQVKNHAPHRKELIISNAVFLTSCYSAPSVLENCFVFSNPLLGNVNFNLF
ncbi:hypothetical protein Ddye_009669 [Dipteronia dyeriana]|uniref:K Homology domain-containing protein n=1 Tax=Dipteronia dyeriana TaxID=168575 RepID=A0AAD9XC69_9ROSI|nr:hypothetical protein Ddye_009669 [Dipteronia dyeriana]